MITWKCKIQNDDKDYQLLHGQEKVDLTLAKHIEKLDKIVKSNLDLDQIRYKKGMDQWSNYQQFWRINIKILNKLTQNMLRKALAGG